MSTIIDRFGAAVSSRVSAHPKTVRKLLKAAYQAKLFQLKHFPDRKLTPARSWMALQSMEAILAPLRYPEKSALVSIFMPCELLQVFGFHPMFAEAMSCYINGASAEKGFVEFAESCGIAETYCSYHKILLGGILSGVLPAPAFIANTSLVCDANNLTFRLAAGHYGIPQYYVDVPYACSGEAIAYVAEQLREFSGFLEEMAGKRLDMEELKAAVARGRHTLALLQKSQKMKKGRFLNNDLTSELYEVFGTHVLLGTPQIETYAEMLCRDLERSEPDRGIRLLWMHTIPYYQESLRKLLNFNPRCQIISCDMNYDEFYDMDPEKPFESMAGRLVMDAFNGSSERRIERSLAMCREQEIDGVVCFCHWGCKQTLAASRNIRQAMEDAGYPVLILDGDGCDRSNAGNGQMATRMEAFVEMLEGRKRK
jgi:benzoyl-CoA reductase/2-hydroxyglutaryl-CoA dehydratase subunit BcrC/BadD/HgdB